MTGYMDKKIRKNICTEAFHILSCCGTGALLLDENNYILEINPAGDRLLQGNGSLTGRVLPDALLGLLDESGRPPFCRVAFGTYVVRQPSEPLPGSEALPEGCRIIVFRDASTDHMYQILHDMASRIKEGIVVGDEDGRLLYCNPSASRMDSLVEENEKGKKINDIYRMEDGSECALPKAVLDRRPILNYRQRYETRHGKTVDAVANTWPVLYRGAAIGAFNIMEDYTTVNDLHRQIIELQEKLVNSVREREPFSDAPVGPEAGNGAGTGGPAGSGSLPATAAPPDADADQGRSPAGAAAAAKRPHRQGKSALSARYTFDDIIFASRKMRTLLDRCRQVARTDSSVIIYGETGTGKELFAQSIHNASPRADGPFLAINCAALPENLLESLLFGSVKGAYTGAENRAGLFEQADGGTLLLDEINSMNISLQAKLLRVLQEGTVRRVGGTDETRVDVRVLSCTNVPPRQAVAEGSMRQDLFYRLGVVNVNIPPLRERKEDIPLLVSHFVATCNTTMTRSVRGVDAVTMEIFQAYSWPGNVRQLQHAIEHAMNILPDVAALITPEYIPQNLFAEEETDAAPAAGNPAGAPVRGAAGDSPAARRPYGHDPAAGDTAGTPARRPYGHDPAAGGPAGTPARRPYGHDPAAGDTAGTPARRPDARDDLPYEQSLPGRLQDIERKTLVTVLMENHGNISKSARILNMSRQNLQYRIKRYGINIEDFR